MSDKQGHSMKRKFEPNFNDNDRKGKHFKSSNGDVLSAAPRELKVLDYVRSHVSEINHLNKVIQRDYAGKTAMQRLPRRLQRRAMSHDIKRMPRSVREYAKAQYENQPAKKKLSRYHRRRPRNLLQEYTRRQRKHVWLETHIWHAKRFHMIEKWGHKIPLKPTDKSYRACYRAIKRHCLLQDLSYMCCIEITGDTSTILQALSHVTSTKTGFTFAAKSCLSGTREGHTILYECGKYPYRAVGPVSFMWKPYIQNTSQSASSSQSEFTPSETGQLWLWCHPSCYSQVWQELKFCLLKVGTISTNVEGESHNLKIETKESLMATTSTDVIGKGDQNEDEKRDPLKSSSSSSNVKADNDKVKISDTSDSPLCLTPQSVVVKCKGVVSTGSDQEAFQQICMRSLSGDILRYRLTGPQSMALFCEALQQANIVSEQAATGKSKLWWKTFFSKEEMALAYGAQRELIDKLKECQSPSELSPSSIVGLIVRDPRVTRPEKRTKIEADESAISGDITACQDKITPDLSSSPLWDTEIRAKVTSSKLPDHAINEMKSENLLPGSELYLGDEESRIPVIVIQRPGSSVQSGIKNGFGSGLDLLLPKGWGMPVWLSLVFCGARCGGLEESENGAFEEGRLMFPGEYPDTQAGQADIDEQEKSAVTKYNRRPPAKRVNYSKYGVVSPFRCPLNELVKEWSSRYADSDSANEIKTQTSVKTATDNRPNGSNNETGSTTMFYVLRDAKLLRHLESLNQGRKKVKNVKPNHVSKVKDTLNELETDHKKAIIQVKIDMVQRGSIGQFGMICIPNKEDIQYLEKDNNYGGPLEPKHIDSHQAEKKTLKREYKEKGIKKNVKVDRTLTVLSEKKNATVLNCSRDVIGFLTCGGYCLGQGFGSGKGFVSCLGLAHLKKRLMESDQSDMLVLMRSNCSFQYRFAKLSLIT